MGMNETNDRRQEGPYKGVETQGKGRQSLTETHSHKLRNNGKIISMTNQLINQLNGYINDYNYYYTVASQ